MLFMVYRVVFRSTESHHLKIKFFFVVPNAIFSQEILRSQTHIYQQNSRMLLQLLLAINIKNIPLI